MKSRIIAKRQTRFADSSDDNHTSEANRFDQSSTLRTHRSLGNIHVDEVKNRGHSRDAYSEAKKNSSITTSLSANKFISTISSTSSILHSSSMPVLDTVKFESLHLPVVEEIRPRKISFLDSLQLSSKQRHDLEHVPRTFFYLNIKPPTVKASNSIHTEYDNDESNSSGSVYDLVIVQQDQINKDCYFTLSKEGVTFCTDKSSTFTSMAQWEREFSLFHRISKIQFFRLYKRWKSFTTWKSVITGGKRGYAAEKLQSELFLFNAPLRKALLNVRHLTLPLSTLGLISIPPGEVFNVDEFAKVQAIAHDQLRSKLEELSSKVLTCVRSACDDVVDEFLKANNIAANHKMTFMERAALRSQCKRLTRYLRVMDVMMSDFLRAMVLDAMEKIVAVVERTTISPIIETSFDGDLRTFISKNISHSHESSSCRNPLFRVIVSQTNDSSSFQLGLSPTLEQLTRCLDGVVSSCLDVVNSFVKVYSSPETEMYVMPEGNDDNADNAGSGVDPVDLANSIRSNSSFMHSRDVMFRCLRQGYNAAREFVKVFDPYKLLFVKNKSYVADVSSTFEEGTVDSFQEAIASYKSQIETFKEVPRYSDVGPLLVDSDELKRQLIPSPLACLQSIREFIPILALKKAQELVDEVSSMNPVISGDPSTVEAYVIKKKTKDLANSNLESYKSRQNYIRSLAHVMEDNNWPIPDSVKALVRMLKESLVSLEANVQLAEGKEEEEAKKFSLQIADECPKLVKKIGECREQLDAAIIGDPDAVDEKVIKYLSQIESDFGRLKQRAEKLQEYQGILKLPVEEFESLETVQTDLTLKCRLWNDRLDWAHYRDLILDSQIYDLDVTSMERELGKYNKTCFLAGKGLPSSKVVPKLKSSVDEINPVVPVVTDLRSPALKDRHWEKIAELVNVDIKNSENFTLRDLIDKGVTKFQEEINVIATSALQESILEEMMLKVTTIWEKMIFDVKPYKDVKDLYILGDVSEVIASLDDSLVTINTVLGSRYVSGIRSYVDTWRNKLMLFQETLDEWLMCQRNWMYLETIFGSPDIARQLPGPAKTFQAVDKSWKLIMKQTNDDPNALKAGTHDKTRKDTFKQHNANLDQIQKDLEDYLETKRMAFPRFYFLSNDELLEILSQAKEPRAVQPHLRKCFDNLVKLEFGAEEGSVDILGMYSSENERVGLGKNLKARGNVEEWLTSVEKRMKESLHGFMKAGLLDYDTKPRDEWIFHHPGQVVATVAQMTWARGTENALRSSDPVMNMIGWVQEYKDELQKLIVKIRGSLSKLMRYIIVALVTTDVHARDILDELREREVTSLHDFLWQQQLRYYWEVDVDNCIIRHSDARILYGYEYMGATSRLVITPLTDRCWLTLTGSYALKLGAAPAGPAGTGKTESSKDLAKAMAIQCVVFNCSDQIDYKMMGKLFRGLAQGGAWVCLDEFNRIDIEVLSVIAQQLLVLREGRISKKSTINFMGILIPLVDHHVIITMNPGYAGRTELPDNLQVCFRPVSMMVPNYALIAEIMLFAEGFGDAKTLSQKMCKLYILCSEQLSQQPHYDYGLRAVKSVLVMAGSLKRSNPNLPEDLVLIRALRDSNVPKFLAEDLPLFAAIVQDLFPGVSIPSNDYGELQVALEEELLRAGLQKVPEFIGKIIQMFDIFNIRFGATLVGPAGTGKSTIYQILAKLMTNLRVEKNSSNPEFQRVTYKILNPKCITMGELYGEFHPLTQEWHDGLASSIMREYVAVESDEKRWTVFDGPIDALWIENMNTVLDDNMTLCLANGQRIKLKWEMKCLFEVNDLAVASPATVSRIGVVYVSPSDLGWKPYVQSWLVRSVTVQSFAVNAFVDPSKNNGSAKANINFNIEAVRERIQSLFFHVFSKGLHYHRRHSQESIESVDVQLVINLCALFQSILCVGHGFNYAQYDGENANSMSELMSLVDRVFFFCYVWSVGAGCVANCWEAFSENAREIFDGMCPSLQLPGGGTAFDYFIDLNQNKFREWNEIVPSFNFQDNVPYFELMVPTTDTCRFSFVMKSLITLRKPVFVTGVTGTGKTVTVQNLLRLYQPLQYDGGLGIVPVFMNFSAQTRSDVTQLTIETKLEKKRKNLLGAPAGRTVVVFVDDVNMPLVETYGAQAPVELLRQFLDFSGFYDRDKLFWKDIVDVVLFVGAAPPGGGRAAVTPRFSRHFNLLSIPPASDANLQQIFSSILQGYLTIARFENEIQKLCSSAVSATIEIYQKISEDLLPTPAKFHYTFNLRDISKVFQGILMIRPRKCTSADTFLRLWVHECQRIFYDRLINRQDQEWFEKTVVELCGRHFKSPLSHEDLFCGTPLLFADFMKPDADPRFYEEIKDFAKLGVVLSDLLDNYNVTFPTQMNLVFFEDALMHTARLARILRQPRGNAMLIGVGGSGKQSLTRMAAFLGPMACLSIEINRGYGLNEFREDLKKFMTRAGVAGDQIVFLFTDSQIIDETMLEDINNILNAGEVPNLFTSEESDKVTSDMIPVLKSLGIPETRDLAWSTFVSRVRDRLHLVLCMSPVGDALRIRCRQFPSLINCTSIDWFHPWPSSALEAVAERFLAHLELPSDQIRSGLVTMCGFVHRSIENTSQLFFQILRRRVYTTPKSYLDLIQLYRDMLVKRQQTVEVKSERMKVGVRKLVETNDVVDGLRAELVKLEPVLKQKSIETEALLAEVDKEAAEANIVAQKVKEEEAIVGQQAAETQAVQADAQRDLDKALPALESAVKALKSLTKADITEVKSFTNPPKAVQVVMEAVCTLLGEKENWENSKKLLSRSDFMDLLTGYDKDNIPEVRLKKLRKQYISAEEMQPEVIQKVSKAGLGLCLWARAMDVYADVAKEVEPKRQRLEEMNAALAITTAALKEKQDQLQQVIDKVALLQKTCDETLAEKNRLQQESETTAKRLTRAEKLTSGLNSEGDRWKACLIDLAAEKVNCIGDVFLACACISYYGGFTGVYRDQLIVDWLHQAREVCHLPCSPGSSFSLSSVLGDAVVIREWQTQGLPTDSVSTANGILVDTCRRWPLMIDPQMQANAWIRKMEEKNHLAVTTMRDPNLLRVLESCIRLGRPLLLEDCLENLEPALEPVLQKAVFKVGSRKLIRLGDSDIDYDPQFKLYLTTKLPNPHYLPEVSIKVTLINFTVTMEGLESQLLGDVVKFERPDIEQRKVSLMLSMAEDKKLLAQLEARILQMLSESEGNILDDEVLINTLSESKMTSLAIAERVSEAEVTEVVINETRAQYLPVATRGSIIYFVIADLALIDPMYQYSLAYYASIFNRCIMEAEKNSDLSIRLQNIISYCTWTIFQNICRGLFEKDKLLFSASICFQILRGAKQIHDFEWNLFMRGPGALDKTKQPLNPQPDKISLLLWDLIYASELRLHYFNPLWKDSSETTEGSNDVDKKSKSKNKSKSDNVDQSDLSEDQIAKIHLCSHPDPMDGLTESIRVNFGSTHADGEDEHKPKGKSSSSNDVTWWMWMNSEDMLNSPIPEPFQSRLTIFQKLLLVKCLREDKLQASIRSFVTHYLGPSFAVSPQASMEGKCILLL